MPAIAAVVHTCNDALRLGRCLETLYPCERVIVVDHHSTDGSQNVAHEYGASVVSVSNASDFDSSILSPISHDNWILCLEAHESLTEHLAASLFQWILDTSSYPSNVPRSVFIREETSAGWADQPIPQLRLVPPDWRQWKKYFPISDSASLPLDGKLLRFTFP